MKSALTSSLILRAIIASVPALLLAMPPDSYAAGHQDHLVTSQAMQSQLMDSASDRQKNIDTVKAFLNSPIADQAIRDAHYNPRQVQKAIPTLSDQELASLAARSEHVQQLFAAGHLTRTELALIAVAFVVVIIVIIVH